jgi:hypothetical protein
MFAFLGGDIGYELGRPPDAAVGKPGGDNAAASVGLFSKYWRLLTAPTSREGRTILLINPFLGKVFPMRTAANATSPPASLSQKSPELPRSCRQFARNNHICGGVYGIRDHSLGDDPMNLPVELQRRLDRRWSARFGMSEPGSRPDPCAAMIGTKSRNLEKATFSDGPSRQTPTKSHPSSTAMMDPSA